MVVSFQLVSTSGGVNNNNNANNGQGICAGSYPSDRVTERRKQKARIEGEMDLPTRENKGFGTGGRTLLAWSWHQTP